MGAVENAAAHFTYQRKAVDGLPLYEWPSESRRAPVDEAYAYARNTAGVAVRHKRVEGAARLHGYDTVVARAGDVARLVVGEGAVLCRADAKGAGGGQAVLLKGATGAECNLGSFRVAAAAVSRG